MQGLTAALSPLIPTEDMNTGSFPSKSNINLRDLVVRFLCSFRVCSKENC
jgi:hypothetical protein